MQVPVGVGVLVALALSAAAQADVLFNDGFESGVYTAGAVPPGTFDPVTGKFTGTTSGIQGKNGGGVAWGTYPDPFNQDSFVTANPVTSASPSSGVANTSSRCIAMFGDSSGGDVHPSAWTVPLSYSPSQSVQLSMDVLIPSAGAQTMVLCVTFQNTMFFFGNYGYFLNGGTGPGAHFTTGYWPSTQGLPTFTGQSIAGAYDAWHNIKITYDGVNKTQTVSFDNQTPFTFGVAALDPTQNVLSAYMDGDHNTGALFVDNISLSTVPAPASLALLGLAGLGARRRR